MSDVVTAEDIEIAETVQANLDAGVYDVGRLSLRHEGAVAAFQDFVRKALAAGDAADAIRATG
jgi:choline monooxygenase